MARPSDHAYAWRSQIQLQGSYRNLRVLFAFNPRRAAILLLGGDKTGSWQGWYDENVPRADTLYEAHLADVEKEGPV